VTASNPTMAATITISTNINAPRANALKAKLITIEDSQSNSSVTKKIENQVVLTASNRLAHCAHSCDDLATAL
jgi:hypothetical protein